MTLKAGCPAGAYGPLHRIAGGGVRSVCAEPPTPGSTCAATSRPRSRALSSGSICRTTHGSGIGLVQYNDRSQRLRDLTNDKEEIIDCVDGLSAEGETRLDTALKEAINVLKRGRPGAGSGLREFVLLYSDGANDYTDPRTSQPLEVAEALAALNPAQQPTAGCDSSSRGRCPQAREPRRHLVGGVRECELACIRRIASAQQFIGDLANPDRLYNYYDQLANAMGSARWPN
ncbi:MAG: VWA domain-containing protein [Ardenticatenales bacterium]|nr:VWA domain-containing protein [Ardenticatenales bacterium]